MSSASPAPQPTRDAVFEPLVELAKARTVALVESEALDREDGEFLLRALIDLETDGVEFFGAERAADPSFYQDVAGYLVARVGTAAVAMPVLAPASAEIIVALAASEGGRAAELLGLPGIGRRTSTLESAVLKLISHEGGAPVQHKFLIHKRGDHVGVAIADIDIGEHVQGVFMDDDSTIEFDAQDSVPLGHKIAVAKLDADDTVLEYGIAIGKTTAPFEIGSYVHTHNLRSARWS